MGLSNVLKEFISAASAIGMSEESYYSRAVRQAQSGDTTDLDAIKDEADTQSDSVAIAEVGAAQTESAAVASGGGTNLVTLDFVTVSDFLAQKVTPIAGLLSTDTIISIIFTQADPGETYRGFDTQINGSARLGFENSSPGGKTMRMTVIR